MAYERNSRRGLALGAFAFVMREDEVAPPTVEIDGLAQLSQGQCTALDVPPRTPGPPHGLPGRFVGSRRLPEDEVQRIALGRVVDGTTSLARQFDHVVT